MFKGLDFRRNLEVVNHTAYSTEEYTKEAVKIISMHDKSKVRLVQDLVVAFPKSKQLMGTQTTVD